MNCFELLENFVPKEAVQHAHKAHNAFENEIKNLLQNWKIPENGWSEERIEILLNEISLLDSNNFIESCDLGEREGRVYSNLVARRNYNFSHGISRLEEKIDQYSKAVGSSVIYKLTNNLVLDLFKSIGLTQIKECIVAPMTTGMSLAFCMMSIRHDKPNAKYVLMPRLDQYSCINSISSAGFTPIIIEGEANGIQVKTDLKMLESKINELKPENIACILSTTSCMAPRAPDNLEGIASLCQKNNIFHLINNAYGMQSNEIIHMINQCSKAGRVDIIIQSSDKNLMVPVGSSIIASFNKSVLHKVAEMYPGRASITFSIDILITILSMGSEKYKSLLKEREENFLHLKNEIQKLAQKHNEKMIETPNNSISLGLTISNLGKNSKELGNIQSSIFDKFISGVKVVNPGRDVTIGGHLFKNFGSHSKTCDTPYVTVAATIGINKDEIDLCIKRLEKVLESVKSK